MTKRIGHRTGGRWSARLAAALLCCAAGCGKPAPVTPPDPAGPAAPVADGPPGSVRVQVTFTGTVPPPRRIQVLKDTEHFAALDGTEVQDVQTGAGGALAGVVVEVHGMAGRGTKAWVTPDGGWAVTQKAGRFRPHVMVVPAAEAIRFDNRDPVLHHAATNAWSYEQQPGSQFSDGVARRTRGFHRVHCNIHSWMEMWVYAAETPYCAVTGPDGRCTIGDLPPGAYTATAAHPTLGRRRFQFTVPAGGPADAAVAFD